jgi:pimeloyl-ACP methyl ester carboxylesterase
MKKQRKAASKNKNNSRGSLWALPVIAAGAWILYSKFVVNHDRPLPEAVEAKRVVFKSKLGVNLNYYVDRKAEGRPLVLIHGVNSGASAYEMRPFFEHYRSSRPVYALELPGFGFSDRPNRTYTPQYFAEALLDFLETQVAEAADVIALSLSCEFAARAAVALPDCFHSLAFISPTGLGEGPGGASLQLIKPGSTSEKVYGFLSNPIWSQATFDLMSVRISLARLYRIYFVDPAPTDLVEYAYATAHQPGAKNVPLAAMSGRLSTADIRSRFYDRIQVPVLAMFDRDPFARFDMLPYQLGNNPHWQEARIVPSLGMPHFEKLLETVDALDGFWGGGD